MCVRTNACVYIKYETYAFTAFFRNGKTNAKQSLLTDVNHFYFSAIPPLAFPLAFPPSLPPLSVRNEKTKFNIARRPAGNASGDRVRRRR